MFAGIASAGAEIFHMQSDEHTVTSTTNVSDQSCEKEIGDRRQKKSGMLKCHPEECCSQTEQRPARAHTHTHTKMLPKGLEIGEGMQSHSVGQRPVSHQHRARMREDGIPVT